jgi:uncharacterized protein with GYD domain
MLARLMLLSIIVATTAAAAFADQAPRITRIEFAPATVEEGGGVWIALIGTGRCTYGIEFGDGETARREAELPDRVRHVYADDKAYDVVATAEAPCEGVARARLDVRSIKEGIWSVSVEPGGTKDMPEIIVNIEGRGTCTVLLDFGDGKSEKYEGALPAKVRHTYASTGRYDLYVRAEAPCRGEARLQVDVK